MHQAIKQGFAFLCFDFAGCGLSDGEFITLGVNEIEDLQEVLSYINLNTHFHSFYLWGRCMGAFCALYMAQQHILQKNTDSYEIKGVVADTPYYSIHTVIE